MSLLWVRDRYDTNKSRYIEDDELTVAASDWLDDRITSDEYQEVIAANNRHTLLPSYGTPAPPHTLVSLSWVRDHYDKDRSRYIEEDERKIAFSDWLAERITPSEYSAVLDAHSSHTLLPSYGGPAPTAIDVISINIPTGATLKVDGITII